MTRLVLTFPDVEALVANYLRDKLAGRAETYVTGVVIDTRVPNPRPSRFVWVRRSGGTRDALRDHPRVDVQVYDPDDVDAEDLAELCRAFLLAMPGTGPVTNAGEFAGLTPIPDDVTGDPRYLFTVELTTRGVQQ